MIKILWHTDYDDGTDVEGLPQRIAAPAGWPADWPVPRVGDNVINQQGRSMTVTAVDWHPYGEDFSDPFVYVVLH